MSLLTKLKSVLGVGSRREEIDSGVSVEREPSDAAEDTETEPSAGPAASDSAESDSETGPAADPVMEIKGIGPAYADELRQADVETVGDLAAADPEELAGGTGLSSTRIADWVEQARART